MVGIGMVGIARDHPIPPRTMTKTSDAASSPYLSDVAGIQRCLDLLTKALGKTPAAVSEGIELLMIELAETRVDRDIKVENLTRERDAARQVAASADGDDRSELSQLRQALGLLSTLAPSLVMDAADPVGMAKRIEAVVRHRFDSTERHRNQALRDVREYDKVRDTLKAECDLHGKRGEESFVDFVRRLAGERKDAIELRDKALAANREWERQAEAIPDVAARNACFALLEKALGEPSPTVSAGIEKLAARLASMADEVIKLADARGKEIADAAAGPSWKSMCESVTSLVARTHEILEREGMPKPMPLDERVEKLVAKMKDAETMAETNGKAATRNADLYKRNEEVYVNGIRAAHDVLTRAGIESPMPLADRVGKLAAIAEQRSAANIANMDEVRSLRDRIDALTTERDVAREAAKAHGPRKAPPKIGDLYRCGDGRLAILVPTDDRWEQPALFKYVSPCKYDFANPEPARGHGERGTQMPGGVAPVPGAKPVPDAGPMTTWTGSASVADRLGSIARGLSYNQSKAEGAAKHWLFELAMLIRGGHTRRPDEDRMRREIADLRQMLQQRVSNPFADMDASIVSNLLEPGDLFLVYEPGAWSSTSDEFFVRMRIGRTPYVRVRWRHGAGVSNQRPAGVGVAAEVSAAHRQLDAAGAAPGTHCIGVGPGETFTVPQRIEWLVGLLHEKIDKAGVGLEELGSLYDPVRCESKTEWRPKSLSTRVGDLCDMLRSSRDERAALQVRVAKLEKRRDTWRARAQAAERLASSRPANIRRTGFTNDSSDGDFWRKEGASLLQNLAAVSQLATSRTLEQFPLLDERAAVRDVRKLLADYLEAKKACGAIANVAGLIEAAARTIAPREPKRDCEVPPTCGGNESGS